MRARKHGPKEGSQGVEDKKRSSGRLAARLQEWKHRLCDPADVKALLYVSATLLAGEAILCILILVRVPYTEVDWQAYMSQVNGFVKGERDYRELKGGTGPIVYPAGYLYLYTALQKLTQGQIPLAQVYFLGLYLINLAVVLAIYIRAKVVPPWALAILCLSKRLHSIFILRLFNDAPAMLLAYAAIFLFQGGSWLAGMLFYSAAVSIKMNVLLMAPPLLLLLIKANSYLQVALALSLAAAVQLLLGLPFLLTYPWAYISRSFNLGRVFIHYWSVNFKFVPEDVFLSKAFAAALMACHLLLLLAFAHYRWSRKEGGLWGAVTARRPQQLSPEYVTGVLFAGNFLGIVFARTLHYQFYSWYCQMLPFLLWRTPFPTWSRVVLWAVIEYCWNVFPSTKMSSLLLLCCHIALLVGLWLRAETPLSREKRRQKAR